MRRIVMATALVAAMGLLAGTVAAGDGDDAKPKKKFQGKGEGKGGGNFLEMMIKRADTNGDGKVSLDEFKAMAEKAPGGKLKDRAEQMFKRLDANGDGFITEDEVKKASAAFPGKGAGKGRFGKKKGEEKKPAEAQSEEKKPDVVKPETGPMPKEIK